MTDFARKSAHSILNRLDRKDITLDTVMNDFTASNPQIQKRDMALINALVYGVVRWRSYLDHIIAHFSKLPIDKVKVDILNALRLGLFQLKFMDKIPESAAVNTSVELSKRNNPPWAVKFVNGLLRNTLRNMESIPFPEPSENMTLHLSVTKSFPQWLVQKWIKRFGEEETRRLCDFLNRIPEITIRTNTLKTSRESLIQALIPLAKDIAPTHRARFGITFTHPETPIHLFPSFRDGWFQVQDEAAQLVSDIMNPTPGERILDACAGLGGKTGHIAQLMNNQGEVIAIDSDAGKLERLDHEMKRLGIGIVKTRAVDLDSDDSLNGLGQFDKILLDAPCSGMGVIRRNPDSKWRLSKKNLNRYKKRQIRFLSAMSGLLKPGGLLVYSVCSTEPEENEAVIDSFLHKHPEFCLYDPPLEQNVSILSLKQGPGVFTSFPHHHSMDGFYIACLSRHTL